MPRSVEDIRGDIDEIKKLLEIATRSTVKDALTLEMRRLETAVSLLLKDEQPVKPTETSAPRQTRCYDVKLTDYAWDQSDKFVKLFVTLKSVGTLAADKISCTFTERSVELSVKELLGRNYSLPIKNLLETIDPSKSHWKVKPDMVVVFMAKNKTTSWSTITADEKKLKEAAAPKMEPPAAGGDPNASLMNMLKQMYESGDDETKRTIAKSFAESRNKNSEFPAM